MYRQVQPHLQGSAGFGAVRGIIVHALYDAKAAIFQLIYRPDGRPQGPGGLKTCPASRLERRLNLLPKVLGDDLRVRALPWLAERLEFLQATELFSGNGHGILSRQASQA